MKVPLWLLLFVSLCVVSGAHGILGEGDHGQHLRQDVQGPLPERRIPGHRFDIDHRLLRGIPGLHDRPDRSLKGRKNPHRNKPEKVTLCHIPPGNPAACHDITISVHAIDAHVNRGSLEGDCDSSCSALCASTACAEGNTNQCICCDCEDSSTQPEIEGPSNGTVSLIDFDPDEFNPPAGPLRFLLSDGEFGDPPHSLLINGLAVDSGAMSIDPSNPRIIVVQQDLSSGSNTVVLNARDSFGRPLLFEETFWAGSLDLTVKLVDYITANPVLVQSVVRLYLAEAQHIAAEVTTSDGEATFTNIPDRTIVVEAKSDDGAFGTVGGLPSEGMLTLVMFIILEVSNVTNLDFDFGSLDGWEVETNPASATIVPHGDSGASSRRLTVAKNYDLELKTMGEGAQYIHHQFSIPLATSSRLRYRFQTDEVPEYFGSEYNDYFAVAIRRRSSSGEVVISSESNSMNGLGLSAFLLGGFTSWRDLYIPGYNEESIVQVDAQVANVGDGEYDSKVIIDFVRAGASPVLPSLSWNGDMGGVSLGYEVLGSPLALDAVVHLSWAGTDGIIGDPIHSTVVPAGTSPGIHGPVNVHFPAAPSGVTRIRAESGENFIDLPDVKIERGINADLSRVTPLMLDIIKAGAREAGVPSVEITSTARTPEQQARAMFDNLVNPLRTVADNIDKQLSIYLEPGQAVIRVFESSVALMSRDEIVAARSDIEAAMVAEINHQVPSKVSKHCADPKDICVVDVGAALLPLSKGQRFSTYVDKVIKTYQGGRILDEPLNSCFHLELGTVNGATKPSNPIPCTTVDGREGTCIDEKICKDANKDPVPATSIYDPKPNCWDYVQKIKCCVESISPPTSVCTPSDDPILGTTFVEFLKLAEGYRGSYYDSSEGGTPTVGYGHKLSPEEVSNGAYQGLTSEQADDLLLEDIKIHTAAAVAIYEAAHGVGAYDAASVWGKRMLVETSFGTVYNGLAQFPKMMKAISENDQETAVKEMLRYYTKPSGEKVYLYLRHQQFIDHCLEDCELEPPVVDCSHKEDGFVRGPCYANDATKPFCSEFNRCIPCHEASTLIADDLCGDLSLTTGVSTPFCDRSTGACAANSGPPLDYASRSTWVADDWNWDSSKYNCGKKATPSVGSFTPMNYVDRITIHHTAGHRTQTALDVQQYHQNSTGYDWCDIGYHFLVNDKGTVFQGRPFQDDKEFGGSVKSKLPLPGDLKLVLGGHTKKFNSKNVGVCLIGCFHTGAGDGNNDCPNKIGEVMDLPEDGDQFRGLVKIVAHLCKAYNLVPSANTITTHGYLWSTIGLKNACPGDNVVSMMPTLIEAVKAEM